MQNKLSRNEFNCETTRVPSFKPYSSETHHSFNWKYSNGNVKADLATKNNRVNYIKNYAEHLTTIPHDVKEYHTIYRNDYQIKKGIPEDPIYFDMNKMYKPNIEKKKTEVLPSEPGYIKYLDTLATTNMLTYVPFTPKQNQGVACKDYVTVWNWLDVHKTDNVYFKKVKPDPVSNISLQSKKFPIRNIPIQKKPVPNFGFCSESKAQFQVPSNATEFKVDFLQSQAKVAPPTVQNIYSTEASMYGSGKRIQEFIKVKA